MSGGRASASPARNTRHGGSRPGPYGSGPSRPARPARSRSGGRRWILLAVVVVLLAGLAAVALGTRAFTVTAVTVTGATPEDAQAVEHAAAVPPDQNLLLLDTSSIAGRVLENPRVARVDVRRHLPGTMTVSVAERAPVLGVPADPGPTVALVDDTGLAYRSVPVRPPGLPVLHLPPGIAPTPAEPGTRAAVAVLTSLPPDLRRRVTDVSATGAYDVSFTLAGGRDVRWGADAENPRKAAVLAALLSRPGHVYDVSTPELAVVS